MAIKLTKAKQMGVWDDSMMNKLPARSRKQRKRLDSKRRRAVLKENRRMKNVATKQKCKKQVRHAWGQHNCSRNAVQDGWCRTHHPDAVEKRKKASTERFKAQVANSIPMQLERAQERITELEAEREKLWEWAKGASYNAFFNPGRKHQNYVIDLNDVKEFLGVKE